MIIGVPKEIKNHEYRVGLTPASVLELTQRGHTILVETQAGLGVGFSNEEYIAVGAQIRTAGDIFASAEMIVKVKEPQACERKLLRAGQLLFTYLHLAPDFAQTQDLLASGVVTIAYETVTDAQGGLPLLAPMSEVAGRMSIQAGAMALEKSHGGAGVLLGGVPGVEPAKVVILGGGVVGSNAARMAVGMRADVTILDRSLDRLRALDREFQGAAKLVHSNSETLERHLLSADLVIGAVLIPGASAPKLITSAHVAKMKKGSVIVDVAIDQGGCCETSQPTTHQEPIYSVDGVLHYCVTNMPGAVARTSTVALNNVTLPYVLQLAEKGYPSALNENPHLLAGLTTIKGKLTNRAVADAHQLPYVDPWAALNE